MQNADGAHLHAGSGLTRFDAETTSLAKDNLHALVVDVVVNRSCSIASTSHTRHYHVGVITTDLLLQLPFDFLGNDRLQACHHVRIRMRTDRASNDIEGVSRMTAPVANGLVGGVLQGLVATLHRYDRCAQHPHSFHVHMLALHIKSTLIHGARHIHQRTSRSCCDTVLTCTCLGNDACLAQLLGQENLSQRIVNLVGTRVVEVFTLQIKLTAILLTHALGIVEWGRTTHVILQQGMILTLELLTFQDGKVSFLQILHRLVENLWNVGSSELSVEAILIYLISHVYLLFNYLRYIVVMLLRNYTTLQLYYFAIFCLIKEKSLSQVRQALLCYAVCGVCIGV